MSAVKAIDNTRPVHYEGFGLGKNNPADLDSRMYTAVAEVERIANDTSFRKPFYMCEYAHAMFNSMGAIGEYNDVFDKYETILGGAIWEWQDQGIYNKRNPNHPIIAYGGGFGEFPNDRYFIHKGVVASDRSLKPHYPEMKKVYQWIKVTPEDLTKGQFLVHNKYQFINLSGFTAVWTLSQNGKEISRGDLTLPGIEPGREALVSVPYKIPALTEGTECFLRISFNLAKDELWARKGFEMAADQFELPLQQTVKVAPAAGQVTMSQNEKEMIITGTDFRIVFDMASGTFSALEKKGVNILMKNGGPRLHLWRAPHRNDDMWADRSWVSSGLRELKWTTQAVNVQQRSQSEIEISVRLTGEGGNNFTVNHDVVYRISGNGLITVVNSFNSSNPQQVVAHLGVRLFLDKQFDRVAYFGRGPMENYADRKRGFDVGLYRSTVIEQLTPYEKPMECGNHEDIRWASLTNNNGLGIKAVCDTTLLQVSMLPYSDEVMDKIEYRIDLPQSTSTVFCINYRTLGVGTAGCGPRPLPKYTVYAAPAKFTYKLQLLSD
jgi:beta-galactosidase